MVQSAELYVPQVYLAKSIQISRYIKGENSRSVEYVLLTSLLVVSNLLIRCSKYSGQSLKVREKEQTE
jgi:hypothetical protein